MTDSITQKTASDGPRAVRAGEMEALRRLTDIVFRPLMPEQYPQLFNLDNCENLRVCFDGDRCVSHVGMVQRHASILGCPIKVCCIGAVATDPEYRGLGLASACFHDAVDKAHADGVDVMLVSGGRGLYTTNGCQHAGLHYRVNIDSGSEGDLHHGITVEEATTQDMELIRECYRTEPVRFTRPLADYRFFDQSGWAMNSPAKFLAIKSAAGREFLGYVVIRNPRPDTAASLAEFGGDRDAVQAALVHCIQHYKLKAINFQVQDTDAAMLARCRESGWEMKPCAASGTIKIINMQQLMNKLTPLFSERAEPDVVAALECSISGNDCVFRLGADSVTINRDDTVRLIFGDHEVGHSVLDGNSGPTASLLRQLLPVPALWYGINYV